MIDGQIQRWDGGVTDAVRGRDEVERWDEGFTDAVKEDKTNGDKEYIIVTDARRRKSIYIKR